MNATLWSIMRNLGGWIFNFYFRFQLLLLMLLSKSKDFKSRLRSKWKSQQIHKKSLLYFLPSSILESIVQYLEAIKWQLLFKKKKDKIIVFVIITKVIFFIFLTLMHEADWSVKLSTPNAIYENPFLQTQTTIRAKSVSECQSLLTLTHSLTSEFLFYFIFSQECQELCR